MLLCLHFTDTVEEFEDSIMQKKMKIPKMSIKNSGNSIENNFGEERMPLRHKKVGTPQVDISYFTLEETSLYIWKWLHCILDSSSPYCIYLDQYYDIQSKCHLSVYKWVTTYLLILQLRLILWFHSNKFKSSMSVHVGAKLT